MKPANSPQKYASLAWLQLCCMIGCFMCIRYVLITSKYKFLQNINHHEALLQIRQDTCMGNVKLAIKVSQCKKVLIDQGTCGFTQKHVAVKNVSVAISIKFTVKATTMRLLNSLEKNAHRQVG